MQTIELELYQFNELSDKAKERARDWWRSHLDLAWCEESRESITAFLVNVTICYCLRLFLPVCFTNSLLTTKGLYHG